MYFFNFLRLHLKQNLFFSLLKKQKLKRNQQKKMFDYFLNKRFVLAIFGK